MIPPESGDPDVRLGMTYGRSFPGLSRSVPLQISIGGAIHFAHRDFEERPPFLFEYSLRITDTFTSQAWRKDGLPHRSGFLLMLLFFVLNIVVFIQR